MNALSLAIDALFVDNNIGRNALYTPEGGSPVMVRIIARRADEITGFGDGQIWSETTRIDHRVAEVPSPRPGDKIEFPASSPSQPGEIFIIQGEPVRDQERSSGPLI